MKKKNQKIYTNKPYKKRLLPFLVLLLVIALTYIFVVNNKKNKEDLVEKYKVSAVGENALVSQTHQRDQIVIPGDAVGLFRAGRYDEAIPEFKRMLASVSETKIAAINNNLGLCYYRLKDYKTAKDYFLESVKQDAKYEKAYYNMALVCEKQGDMEGSRVWYAKTVQINPGNKTAKAKLDAIENLFKTFPNLRNKPQNFPPVSEKEENK